MLSDEIIIAIMGILGILIVAAIVLYVLLVIADWKIFTKAGEPGWKSIIPFYNLYITYKICWNTTMFWAFFIINLVMAVFTTLSENNGSLIFSVLTLISAIALAVVSIMQYYKLAKAFGHGVGYTIGMFFVPTIMTLILGFGKDQYLGPQ